MVDSIDGKKKINNLTNTKSINSTEGVNSLDQTNTVSGVSGTKEVSSVTSITNDNINKIHELVSQLSPQVLKNLPKEKRDLIELAVKMALDAAKDK